MNDFSEWQLQQLNEIIRNDDCPKALDCDDCVIKNICTALRRGRWKIENEKPLTKIAEDYLKLHKIRKLLNEKKEN